MMTLLLTIGLLGQPPIRGPETPKEPAARLEFMKQAAAVHTLQPAGDPNVTYRLEWQYAFAAEANAPIRCTWKGQEARGFDFNVTDNQSRAPYYDWGFSQEP